MNNADAILIVSTDATRTGTPNLLLNQLKWLKANSNYRFVLILQKGGEILGDFEEVSEVYLWDKTILTFPEFNRIKWWPIRIINIYLKIINIFKLKFFVKKLKRRYNVKLIVSNTARNGIIISKIRSSFPCRMLTYVHEGKKTLDLFNYKGYVDYCIAKSDGIIAVSDFVKRMLCSNYNVKCDIKIVPGSFDNEKLLNRRKKQLLYQDLNISEKSIVIMCCGWLGWHKGIDYFIQIARVMIQSNSKYQFLWLGGSRNDESYKQLIFDIEMLGLSNNISIIEFQDNTFDYLDLTDIFLVLSREESFSLVTIEAGVLGKPVLCFNGSGGPCEIVNNDQRFVCPYADIQEMVNKIQELVNNKELYQSMGNYLKSRSLANYTIEKTGQGLLDYFSLFIAK